MRRVRSALAAGSVLVCLHLGACGRHPGSADGGPEPTLDASVAHMRVFVTAANYNGDLGGLAGADAKCNTAAVAANLGGTWRAWLSDSATDAIDRIDEVGPWHLLDGKVAFNNKTNLTTAPVVPIDVNEHGNALGGAYYVWTGTGVGGRATGATCRDWEGSDRDQGDMGSAGATNRADSQWTGATTDGCYQSFKLYCLEQRAPPDAGVSGPDDGGLDYEWARWRLPPDHPVDYACTADTCTDNVTGLLWQRSPSAQQYIWDNTPLACRGLSLGGFSSGWRVPTAIELTTLADITVRAPAINTTAFQSMTDLTPFWTASVDAAQLESAWIVGFVGGGPGRWAANNFGRVFCIHSDRPAVAGAPAGAPAGQYTVDADTVTDNVTGLVWQRCAAGLSGPTCMTGTPITRLLSEAASYCDTLALGGYSSGWRLPRPIELQSIVDRRAHDPAIDTTAFPSTPATHNYATASRALGYMGQAWVVDFAKGGQSASDGSVSVLVRCVR